MEKTTMKSTKKDKKYLKDKNYIKIKNYYEDNWNKKTTQL